METLAEALADDLLDLASNYDANKGSFSISSSANYNLDASCSVRFVSDKQVPAAHPPDVVGGGSFGINKGEPLSDIFTGMIDAVTGELVHGKRTYVLTGETYEGPFCNSGLRHGEDAIVKNVYLPNNSTKKTSLPIMTSESRFYGSYQNDGPHHGTLVVSSQGLGFTYHGPFLNSEPHGRNGTLVKNSGYKYVGDFKFGLFHGDGIETETSLLGGVYEGGFVSGVRQGYGIYTIQKSRISLSDDNNHKDNDNVKGYTYRGQWNANQKQGEGEEFIYQTELYKGQFHMNERHGYGSLTFLNSSPAKEVEVKPSHPTNDSKSNKSTTNLDEIIIKAEGQWRAGKPLNGTHGWTLIYENGDIYTGFATDYEPKGYGVKRFNNRDIYTGQWKNGRRNGEGIYISADGREEYIGDWVDDKIVPLIEEDKDETMVRITDLALTLLNSNSDANSFNHLNNTDNHKKGKSTYLKQREFLERIVEQSLSLSLLHFDKDLKKSNGTKAFPRSWSKRINSTSPQKDERMYHDESEKSITTIESSSHEEDDDTHDCDSYHTPKTKLITYPNGDSYLGSLCTFTNHRQGDGVYLSIATGSTYSGSFENDLRHGFGILLHPLGKYCGNFVGDAKHGMGTLILNDSSSYCGKFEDNLFHGRGTLCSKDGRVYVGEWMAGMKDGNGYETLPDGRVYMGDFKYSKRHGIGTLLSETGGSVLYNGSWLSGVYHGEGLHVKYLNILSRSSLSTMDNNNATIPNHIANMIKYEGSFVNGQRHGFGTLTNTADGTSYKGNWHKDIPISGKWRISINGTVYSGEAYVNDSEELSDDDNSYAQQREDREDMKQRSSVISSDDRCPISLQTDNIIFPQPNGFGTMKYDNGDVYIGQFAEGLRHGYGTCIFSNQEKWDGKWFNDKMGTEDHMITSGSSGPNCNKTSRYVGFDEFTLETKDKMIESGPDCNKTSSYVGFDELA